MFDGTRMRRQREALGLTRAQLARLVEESESMLGHWERGEHEPRPRAIVKLARALGVSTDYLLGVTDEPTAAAEHRRAELAGEGIDAAKRRTRRGTRRSNGSPRGEVQ